MRKYAKLQIGATPRIDAVLVALIALVAAASCGVRWGNLVLIPSDFEGWVVIRYFVASEPVLTREGTKPLIKVPKSGHLSTSSTSPTGYGVDEYYFVFPDGRRQRLRSELDTCPEQEICAQKFGFTSRPSQVTIFFVGRAKDLSRYPKPTVAQ